MADRIFMSGAEAAEAAHFPLRASNPPKGGSGLSRLPCIRWEYEEVRFLSLSELQEYGKRGWEFFHIEEQAGGYRKALGKRLLCLT